VPLREENLEKIYVQGLSDFLERIDNDYQEKPY
jgi:hypothetical protein